MMDGRKGERKVGKKERREDERNSSGRDFFKITVMLR